MRSTLPRSTTTTFSIITRASRSDGKSYVVATLPVNAGFLAPESDPSSVVPAGGIPFPAVDPTDSKPFTTYYQAVTDLLEAAPPEAFQPTLTALDSLIQSLQVSQ